MRTRLGMKTVWCLVGFIIVITLLSCSSFPPEQIDKEAFRLGFTRQLVLGRGFEHVAYFNGVDTLSKTLNVYLEGDGSPWINYKQAAKDPTPRNPLMLHLMALDSGPAVYLGRPCYFGMMDTPQCKPELWTFARYSEEVIDSMTAALNLILKGSGYVHVVLIGHSGGGTIAMLMAERLPQVEGVITLAGNLDIETWASFHNYVPLHSSLNPSTRPPLKPDIYQLHLVGEHDQVVPPAMILAAATKYQHKFEVRVLAGFSHVCCWKDIWSDILFQVKTHVRYKNNLLQEIK